MSILNSSKESLKFKNVSRLINTNRLYSVYRIPVSPPTTIRTFSLIFRSRCMPFGNRHLTLRNYFII